MSERGPKGDHGQDGHVGATGPRGKPGPTPLRLWQVLVMFGTMILVVAGMWFYLDDRFTPGLCEKINEHREVINQEFPDRDLRPIDCS